MPGAIEKVNLEIAQLITRLQPEEIVEVLLGTEPSLLLAADQQQQQQQQQQAARRALPGEGEIASSKGK